MISQSVPFAASALVGRLAWLDLGTSNARIEIYGGTRPASGAAPGVPIIVTITLAKPSGSIADAVATLISSTAFFLAENSGAPTWARWFNGNNEFAFDCDASGPAGTAEVIVSENTVLQGGKVSLILATFS